MYQKEIIYMGLYKDGSRLGSAGFLKVENLERESRLHLKIQNIPLGISGRYPVRVYNGSGWKEIDGITVQDGGGRWEEELREMSDHVILQVILPGEYYLEGRSKTATETTLRGKPRNITEENTVQKPEVGTEERTVRRTDVATEENTVRKPDAIAEERIVRKPDVVTEENIVRRPTAITEESDVRKPDAVIEENAVQKPDAVENDGLTSKMGAGREQILAKGADAVKETPTIKKKKAYPETILVKEELPRHTIETALAIPSNMPEYNLKEDKWEQILDTYENIHPYDDERVYVKLEPKDFVILQSRYQHLVNNSFLLHGFYNYRYIILGKEQDYYLGVPGVFYEREKMVALMFGFEAFECPGGNVRAGEFGYYLRKVEL